MKLGDFLLLERRGTAGQDCRLAFGHIEHQLLNHLFGRCPGICLWVLVPFGPMHIKLLRPELYAALGPLVRGGQSLSEIPLGEKFVIDFNFWLNGHPPVYELVEVREVDLRTGELHAVAAGELHSRGFTILLLL